MSQTVATADPPYTAAREQPPALGQAQTIMAEHDAGAARQLPERAPQVAAHSLISHQPDGRQRVAGAHRRTYSGAHHG